MKEQEINEEEIIRLEVSNESSSMLIDIYKNKPIIFPKLNKYYWILFISPFFCFLNNYFFLKIRYTIKNNYCFNIITDELLHVFAGLFYFISYFRKNGNKGNNNNTGIKYIYNKSNKINLKIYAIFLVILSLFLFSNRFIRAYIYDNKKIDSRFYFIIFIPLFSKFILKENLYKHHYLSIIISIIGWIILSIPICLKIKKEDILANFLNLIHGTIYPLILVLIKHTSDKYYITPLLTSLLFGLISVVLTIIGFIIYTLIKYHDFTFFKNVFDFSKVDNKLIISIFYVLLFLCGTILKLLNMLILFYFSPIFLQIAEVISPLFLWIALSIEKNTNTILELVIYPIGYVIVIFSSLLCNEMIILNFCGLSENTKIFVYQRMDKEISKMNKLIK